MKVRKTLITAALATMLSALAWALPGTAVSHPFGPPTATPNNLTNPGASHRSSSAGNALDERSEHGKTHEDSDGSHPSGDGGHHGASHKCHAHRVGYVAAGTLEKWSLTPNGDGTYSGSVEVLVRHANHHARGDVSSTPKEYKVEKVHLTFALADVNNDGSVGLDDLAKGDSVQLLGKLTALAKKCSGTGFTAVTTIRHIIFEAPPSS